jgi:hypothetical protein
MNTTEIDRPNEDHELLAGYALGDYTEQEAERVEVVLDESAAEKLFRELQRTAAAVQLALLDGKSAMLPEHVKQRVSEVGRAIVAQEAVADAAVADDPRARPDGASPEQNSGSSAEQGGGPVNPAKSAPKPGRAREWFAWFSAAAAFLLALTLWQGNSGQSTRTAAELRQQLLQSTDSLIRVSWTDGKTPFEQQVGGEVVWDNETQRGVMTFKNMPVNDPSKEQYQLWIIDPQRDENPIDGGVFDITDEGEVVVEINAKLKVIKPVAFAITIEQPGGVVVSSQERLPLLAPVEA